ncbi:hypothetical protein BKA62DRAFT_772669 [Auriculariales sp. MPI-PUGE-AT-0066]|nr:hypothetical protein BKA62DRAFT_772669 [Auriculariales sp. MPI-PUGE-AT-0066]
MTQTQLPVELLTSIMTEVEPYHISTKFALASVCAYWRSVALNTCVLWSSFDLDSHAKRNLGALALVLYRGGDAPLDIKLTFGAYAHYRLPGPVPAAWADLEHAASALIQTISAPRVVARLQSLSVLYNSPGALHHLIAADLLFPNLRTLEVRRSPTAMSANLALMMRAPKLRKLLLHRVEPVSWTALLSPTLCELDIDHAAGSRHLGVLDVVAAQSPELRRLTFATYDTAPMDVVNSLHNAIQAAPYASVAGVEPSAKAWLPALDKVDFEIPTDVVSATLVLARIAQGQVVPSHISVLLKSGDVSSSMLPVLLHGLSPVTTISLSTPSTLVIRDSQDRTRTLRIWDEYQRLSLAPLWSTLARSHGLHKSVTKFEVSTAAWTGLAEALSQVPSMARDVALVVRPDGMLLARPALNTAGRSSSPGSWARAGADRSRRGSPMRNKRDELDLESFEMPDGPAAKVLVVSDLWRVTIDLRQVHNPSLQRRGVLRVLRWILPRASSSLDSRTEVCVSLPDTTTREARNAVLQELSTLFAARDEGFRVCKHCLDQL